MKIKQVLIIIFALAVSAFLGYRFGIAQIGSLKSVVEPGSMVTEASYVVFTDGTTVYAKNGDTGEIEFSGTDASQVIQYAIDALPSVGGKIFIKAGIYEVDGIKITSSNLDDEPDFQVIIEGEGRFTTQIKLKDNANGAVTSRGVKGVIVAEGDATGVRFTIRNLGIYGNRYNQIEDISGIVVEDGRNYVLENNYVVAAGKFGILSLNDQATIYRENYIIDNIVYWTNLHGSDPADPPAPVENNLAGIRVDDGDTVVRANIIGWTGKETGEYATGVGIAIAKSSSSVEDNWLWGNKYAIVVGATNDHSIIDNFVEQNDQYGIWLTGTDRSFISNNRIRMGAHSRPLESGAGIVLYGESLRNSITNNKIWANSGYTLGYGIREWTSGGNSPDYNEIIGNSILKSAPGTINDPIVNIGSSTIVKRNIGFITENSGSETVANNEWVDHGLTDTPTIVVLTPRTQVDVWVADRNSTHFQVGSTGTVTVDWYAEV